MSTTLHLPPEGKTSKKSDSREAPRKDFIVKEGDGLLLGFILPGTSRNDTPESVSSRRNSWLQIAKDGSITLTVGSPEMGPNSFPWLARCLARELAVDENSIKTVQRGPSLVGPASAMRTNFWKLRTAGAMARETLIIAAMNLHGDRDRSKYSVEKGVITHLPSRKKYSYGQAAARVALANLPGSAPRIINKTSQSGDNGVPGVHTDAAASRGIDSRDPGVIFSILKPSPVLGGSSDVPRLASRCAGSTVSPSVG